MSYEGFEVWVCKTGHMYEFDAHDSPDRGTWECPLCDALVDDIGYVDTTNCLPYYMDFKMVQLKSSEWEHCTCCDNSKKISPELWKIAHVPEYMSEIGLEFVRTDDMPTTHEITPIMYQLSHNYPNNGWGDDYETDAYIFSCKEDHSGTWSYSAGTEGLPHHILDQIQVDFNPDNEGESVTIEQIDIKQID